MGSKNRQSKPYKKGAAPSAGIPRSIFATPGIDSTPTTFSLNTIHGFIKSRGVDALPKHSLQGYLDRNVFNDSPASEPYQDFEVDLNLLYDLATHLYIVVDTDIGTLYDEYLIHIVNSSLRLDIPCNFIGDKCLTIPAASLYLESKKSGWQDTHKLDVLEKPNARVKQKETYNLFEDWSQYTDEMNESFSAHISKYVFFQDTKVFELEVNLAILVQIAIDSTSTRDIAFLQYLNNLHLLIFKCIEYNMRCHFGCTKGALFSFNFGLTYAEQQYKNMMQTLKVRDITKLLLSPGIKANAQELIEKAFADANYDRFVIDIEMLEEEMTYSELMAINKQLKIASVDSGKQCAFIGKGRVISSRLLM